jgi:hypothetical protein
MNYGEAMFCLWTGDSLAKGAPHSTLSSLGYRQSRSKDCEFGVQEGDLACCLTMLAWTRLGTLGHVLSPLDSLLPHSVYLTCLRGFVFSLWRMVLCNMD